MNYGISLVSGAHDEGKAHDAGEYKTGGSDHRAGGCEDSLQQQKSRSQENRLTCLHPAPYAYPDALATYCRVYANSSTLLAQKSHVPPRLRTTPVLRAPLKAQTNRDPAYLVGLGQCASLQNKDKLIIPLRKEIHQGDHCLLHQSS